MNQSEKDALDRFTVLYIEDNPANLRLVMQVLERIPNIETINANQAEQGLYLAVSKNPNLILLDINLPEMDGYQVLKRLQENKVTSFIPVIAISANAMPKDIERGLSAGFDDYITKPINVKRLLVTVNNIISRDKIKSDES